MVNEVLKDSVFFGVTVSILAYYIGEKLRERYRLPVLNPLLIATILVIGILLVFHIDYETYEQGADFITFLLTPATICLAVPLYRQIEVLKKNVAAILVSILSGCIAHVLILLGIAAVFHVDQVLLISFLPKSVTTPIAIGICGEMGGIQSVTVVGVVAAGILGSIAGPFI